jgi:hypothetical protein
MLNADPLSRTSIRRRLSNQDMSRHACGNVKDAFRNEGTGLEEKLGVCKKKLDIDSLLGHPIFLDCKTGTSERILLNTK